MVQIGTSLYINRNMRRFGATTIKLSHLLHMRIAIEHNMCS